MKQSPLEQGRYYHIYNCGIDGRDLFKDKSDYEHFLSLYEKYIDPVAETFAWVLMGNHFHLLVRVKENVVYKYTNADRSNDAVRFDDMKWETCDLSACEVPVNGTGSDSVKKVNPNLHFSHLFNAYSKYFNKKHNRHGSMFERAFKRKIIDTDDYFRRVVLYIHNNPVHHGFCEHPVEYPWSSYLTCISVKPTKLQRDEVIGWFDSVGNFKYMHEEKVEITKIEKWLEI